MNRNRCCAASSFLFERDLALQGTSWGRGISNTQIIFRKRLRVKEIQNFRARDWMASSIHSLFKFPALPLSRGAIASPLYEQNRTKENDEAARKQNN
jgi:hypothetical protein